MIKKQFLKFVVIGVLSTTVNYSIFYILYQSLSVYYMKASSMGFIVGVLAGYRLNKSWTFCIKEKTKDYIYKYFIVYFISLILGLGLLKFFVTVLGIVPKLATFLMIGFTTCTNFLGTKFLVFKR